MQSQLKCLYGSQGPKNPEHNFPKKNVLFLNFIGPVTPPWVLYLSEIMHMFFSESLLARAVFTRSIRLIGWQPGSQNPGSTIFRKKTSIFLKFIGAVTPPWVLYPSEIMHLGFTIPLLTRAVFAKSIKVFVWQPGTQKSGAQFSEKKRPFFEIHRTSDTSMGFVAL